MKRHASPHSAAIPSPKRQERDHGKVDAEVHLVTPNPMHRETDAGFDEAEADEVEIEFAAREGDEDDLGNVVLDAVTQSAYHIELQALINEHETNDANNSDAVTDQRDLAAHRYPFFLRDVVTTDDLSPDAEPEEDAQRFWQLHLSNLQ